MGSIAQDPWNRLDFLVLISSLVSIVVKIVGTDTKLHIMRLLRFFRIGRAMRTFGRVQSLRTVVGVLFRALHQLRISFVFAVVLIVFSCLAVQL